MSSRLAAAAERLRALHHAANPLILPNAWDVASARAVERAGAPAVATTSSGVAASLGYPDGEVMPVDEMLGAVARTAAAVAIPVTADLETGYGLAPDVLVDRLLAAGAVGLNLEDTDRSTDPPGLTDVDAQAARLAAVRGAAEAVGVPIVINARIDVFLRDAESPEGGMEEALQRGRAYLAAGVDCVYPIWLADPDAIGRLVRELQGPVNILVRPGAPDIGTLVELGVRRISVGGGLARHAAVGIEALARRLLAGDSSPFAELGES